MDDVSDWVAAKAGDGEAFGRIFDRHHARVRRHAHANTDNKEDAEDVAAAAFLELWRRREAVRIVDGSILPWLLVTTNFVARNVRRNKRRYRALLQKLPPEVPPSDVWRGDSPSAVERLVQELPGKLQDVVVLRLIEDLSEIETASVLRIPVGTVKSRLSRAKSLLKISLAYEEKLINV